MDFLVGNVQVKSIQPSGGGYEFKLANNSYTDQIVEQFRILPYFDQGFILETNKSVYAKVTEDGVIIPGGNSIYMPAFEFNEMNGYVLNAKSEVKFRISPLVARSYMVPKSMVVYVEYSTKSKIF